MDKGLVLMVDNDIRVLRVIRERRLNAARNMIVTGLVLIASGLCLSVWYARPEIVYVMAFPIVLAALVIWRWYVWVSV